MRPTNGESGIFHIFAASGTGKTSITAAATSVWRNGETGLDTWNSTANATEELFTRRNHGLISLDEVTLVGADAKSQRSSLQQVAHRSTQPKGRQRSELSQPLMPSEPFRFFGISNGEKSAAAMAREAGGQRMRGEQVRFIDTPARCVDGHIFDRLQHCQAASALGDYRAVAKAIRTGSVECHGTAGPAFLRYIVGDPKEAVAEAERFMTGFMRLAEVPQDGSARRIAAKFALAYAAGQMAINAQILPWSPLVVLNAVRVAYKAALDHLASQVDPVETALARLQEWVRGQDLVDLTTLGSSASAAAASAAKAIKYTHQGQVRLLIPGSALTHLVDERSRHQLLDQLRADKVLVQPRGDTPRKVWELTPVKGMKPRWYYVFDTKLIDYGLPSTWSSAG